MNDMFCGVDFGTSNSSVALANDAGVRVLPLDDANFSPTSLPSLLYISSEGDQIIGRDAANAFIDRNVDREVILQQVDLGISIEEYVASEPDKSASYRPPEDSFAVTSEATRAHALVEVNSPGRLFQSLKSSLKYREFTGTEVFGREYQIEELVSIILKPMKIAADTAAGKPVTKAVFGRPVNFSTREAENDIAEDRLRRAAALAGFEEVSFFYEPVAACVEYAVETERKQRLMVVDIGGGTCDVCVMEFGGGSGAAARLAESRILGVGGVPVAGDAVDQAIIRHKLFPSFGSRARYGPSQLPMPQNIYNSILDWQNLYKLNTEETINWLIAAEASSTDPAGLRSLRCLIQQNYGYPMVRTVEAAKRRLTDEAEAPIEIRNDDLQVSVTLSRTEFDNLIEEALEDMLGSILEAEKNAQIQPGDIDLVLTTGGTSLIPAVRHMLFDRYGREKLLERDTFTSVAAGLAVVARFA
jgi:hypothetical chaperone protein